VERKRKSLWVLDYNLNMGRLVPNTSSFDTTFWKDKITERFIRMLRILLTGTLLNCMIIYNANWGQPKIYHFKFRVDLILAVLTERGSGGERKVQWCHSIDKNVSWLLERHFPKSTTNTGKGHANKKVRRMLQTRQKEGDCFGALSVRLDFVFRTVSRYFTPTLVFKVRLSCILKGLEVFYYIFTSLIKSQWLLTKQYFELTAVQFSSEFKYSSKKVSHSIV
jgi:hypothetical protein